MRIVYIVPRYHQNMIATMKGWKDHGDSLCLITQYCGSVEDHSWVEPIVIGYSWISRFISWIYANTSGKRNPYAKNLNLKYGIPPVHKLAGIFRNFHPDLVILRERSLYTIGCFLICRRMHLRVILYNQSPLWAEPGEFKDDISHRIVRRLTPRYRLTTSHQKGICIDGKIRERYAYFTPFVMGPACAPENKKYFQNGHINIMETGKYEKRKNHFMMVNVFEKLLPDYPEARLTIVGEAADRFQREYFDRLSEYISDHHLEEVIVLKKNLSRAEMGKEYQKADIFVLPSTGEPASVSIAEAMAYSIPVIGGTDNGTADYISDGITGAVFKDKDEKDLFDKMKAMLEDRTVIMNMGKAAYQDILDRFQFKDYYATICQIMSDQDRGV